MDNRENKTNNYGTTTFTIKLRAAPGRDAYRELKGLLKIALRRHGLKAISVVEASVSVEQDEAVT